VAKLHRFNYSSIVAARHLGFLKEAYFDNSARCETQFATKPPHFFENTLLGGGDINDRKRIFKMIPLIAEFNFWFQF